MTKITDTKKLPQQDVGNPLPQKIGIANTDVVQIAPLRARAGFTQRLRPVPGGASGAVNVPELDQPV